MATKQEWIALYANELEEKCGVTSNKDLLEKVTMACGPSIFNPDAAIVSGSSTSELETVKQNFLVNKLGLPNSPALDEAIDLVLEKYGRSNRNKYRVVVYYLLTLYFQRESVLL